MFVQQPYFSPTPQSGFFMPSPPNQATFYTMPAKPQQHPMVAPATQLQTPSPPLTSALVVDNAMSSPSSANFSELSSDCSSSSFSISLNAHAPSPQTFSVATPPPVVSPQSMPGYYPHPTQVTYVCSPGPVMYDPAALQSAWTVPPQNLQWQPVWVQPPVQQQQHVPVPPGYQNVERKENSPPAVKKALFRSEKHQNKTAEQPARKSNRVRCKFCSAAGSRVGSVKDIPMEDIREATRPIPEVMAELPEFFGEPQLNFEEFVHYSPIFRTPSLNGDVLYFKIPRTTKERELNIPRRLCELYNRTFGPDDAPESKAFERISAHNHLCGARCAIRNSIVKAMEDTIFSGCRNAEEGNDIFSLIFRFVGVSTVKSITTNLPQVFTAVVTFNDEKKESELQDSEAFECTGVVSLFNYHLFRRRIKDLS